MLSKIIRKATIEDLPALLAIYEHARQYMAQNGNPHQWGDDQYPQPELLKEDMEKDISFVLEQNGQVEAAFVFFIGEDPAYLRIDEGAWRNNAPYGVIHRVASSGRVPGVTDAIFEWCAAQIDNLRMDTHHDNKIMQHILEKHGFCRCGIIYVRGNSPRIAYHFVKQSGDEICTYSHIFMNPLEPRAEDLQIRDIAHALSLMTRANGHFPDFYSVGQHCLSCAEEASARGYSDRLIKVCLIHDAGEAYLSDVTRPVKRRMDFYNEVEGRLLSRIYTKFLGSDLSAEEKAIVKEIDDAMLFHEFYHFMKIKLFDSTPMIRTEPDYGFKDFKWVETEYLKLFESL